ncbi:MAG: endopeptidase La [Bacteroidaceae bacterium]|nr:endopeptidase La [Bacteroidaceae bacterium]
MFNNNPFDNTEENESPIMPIFTEIEGNIDLDCKGAEENDLPILPLRNMVMYPGVALPVSVGRSKSLKIIKEAYAKKKFIGVVCQRDMTVEDPELKDLYPVGSVAEILKILEMPDNGTTVILQGKKRFEIKEITSTEPYLRANVSFLEEIAPPEKDKQYKALISAVKDLTFNILKTIGEATREMIFAIRNIESIHYMINFLCTNIPIEASQKQKLLEIDSIEKRTYMLYKMMSKEAQLIEIKADIQSKAREDLSQQQREHFLQQQIKTIQDELGGNTQEQDIIELRQKAEKKKWNQSVADTFEKEVKKLERLHPQSPDFSIQFNYLQTMIDLPWNEYSKDSFNLKHAQRTLDKDHYGLEKVKERIIEHLAVLKLRGDLKSPIICLYGPPGVGKTSLGKSIAESLKRKYVRMSLGGLHDEAEIRGHRRTYIGAMPGRIIQGLLKAKTSNPVFVLDEIDKIGNDFKGDPASALLEVLDPEQNSTFHDNYLDIDYDLSKILFIATANNLNTISQPLLDRMELIDISGYIQEEKVEIARRHLLPKQLENNGLEKGEIDIPKKTMNAIVENYTRESGVRELDKKIAKILRKIARKKASEEEYPKSLTVSDLKEYLGMQEYSRDKYEGNEYPGVVTGLAWTAVGGEILFVESSLSKSKREKLTLTGNLGDVMKESAVIAMQYIKSHADLLNIPEEVFDKWSVHIHVPEGAIPKDGPSAGITMITSLASSFTQRKVKPNLAMTGEITLRGRVLPVGGIKEKILAAKRANIKEIILSEENRKDIEEIKDTYIKGLTFHYVKDIKEVLDLALLKEKVAHPLNLN